jgi:hypothetical protein
MKVNVRHLRFFKPNKAVVPLGIIVAERDPESAAMVGMFIVASSDPDLPRMENVRHVFGHLAEQLDTPTARLEDLGLPQESVDAGFVLEPTSQVETPTLDGNLQGAAECVYCANVAPIDESVPKHLQHLVVSRIV